ncbi:hypothetical protein C8J57DRAFT_1227058 [Mycena rebaudengoi]|nr:hypothetical protein C8J57DRAFT_1227058 [Mycena rebaudengoi]
MRLHKKLWNVKVEALCRSSKVRRYDPMLCTYCALVGVEKAANEGPERRGRNGDIQMGMSHKHLSRADSASAGSGGVGSATNSGAFLYEIFKQFQINITPSILQIEGTEGSASAGSGGVGSATNSGAFLYDRS